MPKLSPGKVCAEWAGQDIDPKLVLLIPLHPSASPQNAVREERIKWQDAPHRQPRSGQPLPMAGAGRCDAMHGPSLAEEGLA